MTPAVVAFATAAVTIALTVAGIAKLARPGATRAALVALGWPPALARASFVRAAGALELALAAGTALQLDAAQIGAAIALGAFTGWLALLIARGRSGTPCPCYAGRSTVGPAAVARSLALAALALGVALAPTPRLSTEGWLALAVGALALGCLALGLVALTLAREVALARAARAPRGALEIDAEGPDLASVSPLIERFGGASPGVLAIAVFVSPGCRMCQELRPAIEQLARHPAIAIELFDEQRDSLAWQVAGVPGSPYAVALDNDGTVLAKGTFNTAEQLESIPATALQRRGAGLARA